MAEDRDNHRNVGADGRHDEVTWTALVSACGLSLMTMLFVVRRLERVAK